MEETLWAGAKAKRFFEVLVAARPELEWQEISIKPTLMIDDKACCRNDRTVYHCGHPQVY